MNAPLRLLFGFASSLVVASSFGQGWRGYGGNAQHTGLSPNASVSLGRVLWHAPVDLNPQYSGSSLLIHYGSPIVTASNTVILTVKTGASDGFRFEGRDATTGNLLWTQKTDYSLPGSSWTPSCAPTLIGNSSLAMPGGSGSIWFRKDADSASSSFVQYFFYGTDNGVLQSANGRSNIKICSPLVSSGLAVYFGFRVDGTNPAHVTSGIARIVPGQRAGVWTTAAAAAGGDNNIDEPAMNCSPCLSNDGTKLYCAVKSSGNGYGYLVVLNSTTLAPLGKFRLKDPKSGNDANITDLSTASPMVGSDGDVYYGVLEQPFGSNRDRGWLLHFNSTLSTQKTSGAFGWDDTASMIPASAVPGYLGSSQYLLCCKYNDYAGLGGQGDNQVAVLDPNDSQLDVPSGAVTMKVILSVLGPTPDSDFTGSHPNAVREWCINTAAIDPINKCAIVNSEDGKCYRWNFTTNTLDQAVTLTAGIGEAYTPTVIAPNGISFAISNATIYALGQ